MANRVTRIISFVIGIVLTVGIFGMVVLSYLGVFDTEYKPKDESSEYKIQNYTLSAVVNKDCTIDFSESIEVEFLVTGKHGIFRALEEISNVAILNDEGTITKMQKMWTKSALTYSNGPYEVVSENNINYFRFGSEDVFVPKNAVRTYEFNYTISLDSRYASYDQFSYNILGNLWATTIDNFEATVTFAEAIDTSKVQLYAGTYGEGDELTSYEWNADNTRITITKSNIGLYEGITLFTPLSEGYFTAPFVHVIDFITLVAILIIALMIFIIFKKNNNSKITTPVVQFKVNGKYTSADVGYIIDKKVNNKDIASLFIYWANKGYINIIVEGKKTYVQKLKEPSSSMKNYEKNLFKAIFDGTTEKLDISKIGDNIVDTVATTRLDISQENSSMFNTKASLKRGTIAILAGIIFAVPLALVNYQVCNILFMILSLVFGIVIWLVLLLLCAKRDKQFITHGAEKLFNRIFFFGVIGLALVFAIASYDVYCDYTFNCFLAFGVLVLSFYLIYLFNIRTDEGIKELGDIVGVRDFILATEQSRLELMAKENPQIFFDIMPFAYVLDVYDEWCKRFEKIVIDAPSWYITDGDVHFNTFVFAHALSSINTSVLNSINSAEFAKMAEKTSSVGGGSIGGGGFSGGGFGGGGGGSW